MNVSEAIRPFLADMSATLRSAQSRDGYRQNLNHLASCVPGDLKRITEQQLIAWVKTPKRDGATPAPNTIRQRIKVAKRFFRWAHRTGLTPTNPAADLSDLVHVSGRGVRRNIWLTEPQVEAVIATCGDDEIGVRDRALLTIGFFTGLRLHEIVGLRWGMIDLEQRNIHIVGKGNKHADLGIAGRLHDVLADLRLRAHKGLGRPVEPNDPVLPSAHSQWTSRTVPAQLIVRWDVPLGETGCYMAVKTRAAAAGIPDLAPHDMRRSLAGILDNRGVSLADIRDVLRHDSVATTERYLEKNPARATAVLKGFEL